MSKRQWVYLTLTVKTDNPTELLIAEWDALEFVSVSPGAVHCVIRRAALPRDWGIRDVKALCDNEAWLLPEGTDFSNVRVFTSLAALVPSYYIIGEEIRHTPQFERAWTRNRNLKIQWDSLIILQETMSKCKASKALQEPRELPAPPLDQLKQ